MGKVSRSIRLLCSAAPLLCSLAAGSCVPEELEGIHFNVPINSGAVPDTTGIPPKPQVVQPAQPAPPLPTDVAHSLSEWPPAHP